MRAAVLAVGLVLLAAAGVPSAAHVDHVTATPQVSPDGTITVETAFVGQSVWLVVRADDDGERGRPVGHAFLDPSGDMTDVPVPLSPDFWADGNDAHRVWIDLAYDDGDGTYDPETDPSMTRLGQFSPVSVVVRDGNARAYVGAADFGTQSTNGTVVIRQVSLPTDGHLVLRNGSRSSPGDVVGHATLPAGDHADVAVGLDASFYERAPTSFSLRATAYRDDGDGTLDDGDRPIAVGDATVGSWFRVVKRSSSATATPEESELVNTAPGAGDDASPVDGPSTAFPVGAGVALVAIALTGVLALGWYRWRTG